MRRPLPHRQQGQALVEFTVVSLFVLVPLFLIVPVVARVISQQQDVELAARYAAWERTVWYENAPDSGLEGYRGTSLAFKSDQQLGSEVDTRIFSQSGRIVSGDNNDAQAPLDPFSRRQNGSLTPLIQKSNESYASIESSNGPVDGMITQAISALSKVMSKATRFDMPSNGLVNATASVGLVDLGDVFGRNLGVDSLSLGAHNTLYTESWSAGGRGHAEYRIQGLMPQQFLDNDLVKTAQDLLSVVPLGNELHSDCLIIGHTTIEPLPEHRLREFDGVEGDGGSKCSL